MARLFQTRDTHDNHIANNLVRATGRDYVDAAGIYLGFATRSLVEHNDIIDVPWAGIAIGRGWGLLDPGSSPVCPAPTAANGGRTTRRRQARAT